MDIIKVCWYCKNCKKCERFYSIKSELKKKKKNGFQTYNKHIKYWDIRDPKFNERNRNFEIRPIRDSNLECKIINSLTMISRKALELFLH